jgi:proteasome accessory factor A
MAERMLGVETEYGISWQGSPGREPVTTRLLGLAAQRYPHLPSRAGNGCFLGNGARFYIDSGGHPEWCTPEVDNPWEAVLYLAAGDELLAELAAAINAGARSGSLTLFKCNVDYSGAGTTWACHENYGHKVDPARLPPQIIPHLVSRVIYTGAGGLNPFAQGIQFCLSPRVYHLGQVTSGGSTSARGIYHLKDESLARSGWHRLHVLCGESVCSQQSAFLKLGVTGLIVAMIDAGLRPGDGVELSAPVEAMQQINADPTATVAVTMRDQRSLTAIEIQEHYLRCAEAHLHHRSLPEWAGAVVELWRETLQLLRRGPRAVGTRLDWSIKHALFQDRLAQHGLRAERIEEWNQVLGEMSREHVRAKLPGRCDPAAWAAHTEESSPAQAALGPILEARGLTWGELANVLRVRSQLCELDLRFGQLGPAGIFSSLEAAGVLEHRLPRRPKGLARSPVRQPPRRGRARVRGELIQSLCGRKSCTCDWAAIWDHEGAILDLSDPFVERAPEWKRAEIVPLPPGAPVADQLELARHDMDRGNYERAFVTLAGAGARLDGAPASVRQRYLQLLTWVQARRGEFPAAAQALRDWSATQMTTFAVVNEHVALHRFKSLVHGPEIWSWLSRGEEMLRRGTHCDSSTAFAFRGHQGYALACAGRWAEAQPILEAVERDQARRESHPRLMARALTTLGDIHRAVGHREEAARCLRDALTLQTRGEYFGEMADFTLINQAKLAGETAEARGLLDRAWMMQLSGGNRMGMARTLFLQARILREPAQRERLRLRVAELVQGLTSLHDCPTAQTALRHWTEWCDGATVDGIAGDYWGL